MTTVPIVFGIFDNLQVKRHRISSGRRSSSTCSRAPILNFKRSLNTSTDECTTGAGLKSIASTTVAKDYVESLHQNSRATLLYGKNNVHVVPVNKYLSFMVLK